MFTEEGGDGIRLIKSLIWFKFPQHAGKSQYLLPVSMHLMYPATIQYELLSITIQGIS